MTTIVIPDSVRLVLICADHDARGTGEQAAKKLARRMLAEGRRVKISCPRRQVPIGLMEWKGHSMAEKITQETIEHTPDVTADDILDPDASLMNWRSSPLSRTTNAGRTRRRSYSSCQYPRC